MAPAASVPAYGFGMAGCGNPFCTQAAFKVLSMRQAMVIGPTPPGTGVMAHNYLELYRRILKVRHQSATTEMARDRPRLSDPIGLSARSGDPAEEILGFVRLAPDEEQSQRST